ncbi:MAG: DUF2933 domain-containing protein [Xanthomonadaceae bacterium]|nr:DUF2933 domain-containing protein [Xanthomonadaceae bacterium]
MTAKPTQNATGSRRWVFWMFLVLALFYLGFEHRAHLAGTLRWLPLAILLLCPFMHMFMHKGHGGHGGHGRGGNADDTPHGQHESRSKRALNDETSDTSNGGH